MSNKIYSFTINNGAVTAVYELKDGTWELDPIEGNETYAARADGSVSRTESYGAFLEVKVYTPGTVDGTFVRTSEYYTNLDGSPLANPPAQLVNHDLDDDGRNDDVIVGSSRDDIVNGLDGDDRIDGSSGNDDLYGSNGNDDLYGGSGNDDLFGGSGADDLYGNLGDDRLNGNSGGDYMAGGVGNDTYTVDSSADRILEAAGAGTDLVSSSVSHALGANVEKLVLTGAGATSGTGNGLANSIVGNGAANVLSGLAGGDQLAGGAGADTLFGGAGNDVLAGGLGRDQLTGGLGADIFRFASPADSAVGTLRDVITDFSAAQGDKLSLAAIDANPFMAGDQMFLYIGDDPFTRPGQARFDTIGNDGPGLLELNLDNDATAEVQVLLNNVKDMFASDFVL